MSSKYKNLRKDETDGTTFEIFPSSYYPGPILKCAHSFFFQFVSFHDPVNNPTLFLDTPPHHHATFCLLPLLNLPDFLGPNFRGYNFIFIVVLFWDCILITPFLFPFHYSKQFQIFFLLYFKTITSFFISCYCNAHIHTQLERERDRQRQSQRDRERLICIQS